MKLKTMSAHFIKTALFTSGIFGSGFVWAQDDLFSMSIEELMQMEVASATLSNETLVNVPGSAAVFTRQDINQLGFSRLDEILNYVTGMQSTQSDRDARFNKISSRGRSSSVGGREILLLINGQRINTEYSGNNAFSMALVPLSIVEKIEVIKGPGSSLYGSNAFLAVINVLTRKNEQTHTRLATGNMGVTEASLSTGFKYEDISVHLSAAVGKSSGDNYTNVTNSFDPSEEVELTDKESHRELLFNLQYKDTELKVISSNQESEDFYLQGNTGPGINRSETDSLFVTLNQHIDWFENAHSEIWLDYRKNDNKLYIQGSAYGTFSGFSNPESKQPLIALTPIEETAHGIRVNNFYQPSDTLRLSLGLEYRQSELNQDTSQTNFDYASCLTNQLCMAQIFGLPVPPPQDMEIDYYQGDFKPAVKFVSATEREIYGAFIQAQWRLRDDTEITAGIRHDDYTDSGTSNSPRLSIVHNFNDTHTFKTNYGEAYRAPQLNEIGLANNTLVEGNPDLTAETIRSLDAIWLTNFEEFTTSLTYFQHKIDDAILIGVQNQVVKLINSSESQKTEGLEAELTYFATQNLSLQTGLTHIFNMSEGQYRESDFLAYAIVNYAIDKWNINFSANYQSDKQNQMFRQDNARETLPSFWVANTHVSYQLDEHANLFATVKNLLDEDYYTPSVSNLADGGVPNRGRSWLAGVSFAF
ncbi:TonB-dependent receptor plug domain-containing protein [Gayadomonas joobiniege]|uniref:TonB-dependent receptor plug domain-containing protein n=1 Tax=Gayadomonas joobiniege TaxID=1234606 RepID=UPI0003714DE8|nr:TonB-dependent receptor [Gayadomonas joobiniege]